MAVPKNNKYWMRRKSDGRKAIFETAQDLWDAAVGYFEAYDKNPWKQVETNSGIKEGVNSATGKIEKLKNRGTKTKKFDRPFSIIGMCAYIGISHSTWKEMKYRYGKGVKDTDHDFIAVINQIETIVQTKQLEGAMIGEYNANIVARLIGLSDRIEVVAEQPLFNDKISGDDIAMLKNIKNGGDG